MIVDLHTHLWESLDQLGVDAAASIRQMGEMPWDRPVTNVDSHRLAMEPVTYSVILGFESRYLGASISIEQISKYVQLDPGKYIGFGGVDPMKPGFLAQVDLAVARGLSGIVISPAAQAYHPEHTRAMQLYEKCEALGLPIMVHGPSHLGPNVQMRFAQPFLFDEVARTFPKLRMVISQLGFPWVDQTMLLIGKHEHVYADLSHVASRPLQLYNTILLAHQLNVIPKVLLGSDFPFSTPQEVITTLYSLGKLVLGTQMPIVPREQIRAIVERDTLACLGIEHPKAMELKKDSESPESPESNDGDKEKPTGDSASEARAETGVGAVGGRGVEGGAVIKVAAPETEEAQESQEDEQTEEEAAKEATATESEPESEPESETEPESGSASDSDSDSESGGESQDDTEGDKTGSDNTGDDNPGLDNPEASGVPESN